MIKQSCKKTSAIDSFPHQIFINCIEPLSTAIANLTNLSLREGHFPSLYKTAQITPLLKKPNLDQSFPTNYRPISNSTTISKIRERAILKQFQSHIINNPNYSKYQSAYRSHPPTETALTYALDEVFSACNNKMLTVSTGLDLSAAFEAINHQILIGRLSEEFGNKNSALKWISSYITDRKQFVKIANSLSSTISINQGVPQNSVLGPLLFTCYISPVGSLIQNSNLLHHQYADDITIIEKINPNNPITTTPSCIETLEKLFGSNHIQLNKKKTEIIKFGTSHQLKAAVNLTNFNNLPSNDVMKTLGLTIDSKLTFNNHITRLIKFCNYHFHAISHIRLFLTDDLASSLVRCLVLNRIDYCNSAFCEMASLQLKRLQRVVNKGARIVLNCNFKDHYLNTFSKKNLQRLHWLPVENPSSSK